MCGLFPTKNVRHRFLSLSRSLSLSLFRIPFSFEGRSRGGAVVAAVAAAVAVAALVAADSADHVAVEGAAQHALLLGLGAHDLLDVGRDGAELLQSREAPLVFVQPQQGDADREQRRDGDDRGEQEDQDARLSGLLDVRVDLRLADQSADEAGEEVVQGVRDRDETRGNVQDGHAARGQDDHRGGRGGRDAGVDPHHQHQRTQDHPASDSDETCHDPRDEGEEGVEPRLREIPLDVLGVVREGAGRLSGPFAHELQGVVGGEPEGPQKLASDQDVVPRAGAVDADQRSDSLPSLHEGKDGQTDPQDGEGNELLDGVLAGVAFQEREALGHLFGVHDHLVVVPPGLIRFLADDAAVGDVGLDLDLFRPFRRRGRSGYRSDLCGRCDLGGRVFVVGGGG
mmetsp:Transcript_21220/g.50415  ORF Transcript_21220/g.50415 Transcript_21220/m.50415 type:complete len:397 (+) Transcript_21220:106-1296(+)